MYETGKKFSVSEKRTPLTDAARDVGWQIAASVHPTNTEALRVCDELLLDSATAISVVAEDDGFDGIEKKIFQPPCRQHFEQLATKNRRFYNRQHFQEKTGQVLHGTDMSVKGYAYQARHHQSQSQSQEKNRKPVDNSWHHHHQQYYRQHEQQYEQQL